MKEIYEWLYDEYAEAALCQEPLFQDHVLEEVLAAAPEDIRLGLFDQVAGHLGFFIILCLFQQLCVSW